MDYNKKMTSRALIKLQQDMSAEEAQVFKSAIMGKSKERGKCTRKGKAPLPKEKNAAFQRRQVKAKEQELGQAIRTSAKEAGVPMGKVYRALASSSESEDEYVAKAVACTCR